MKKTYLELLRMGKEAIADLQAPFTAKKAHKDLEVKILDIEQKIAEADDTIQKCKAANPPEWSKVGQAIDDKQLLERRLKQFQELETELFPK